MLSSTWFCLPIYVSNMLPLHGNPLQRGGHDKKYFLLSPFWHSLSSNSIPHPPVLSLVLLHSVGTPHLIIASVSVSPGVLSPDPPQPPEPKQWRWVQNPPAAWYTPLTSPFPSGVQVWVEYVMFMLGGGDLDATRQVGDRALTAVGTHVAEGVLVWQVVLLVEKQVGAVCGVHRGTARSLEAPVLV